MGTTYSAVAWRSPERLVVEDREVSELAPDHLRIEVTSAGLCGTDLSIWKGTEQDITPGTVLGHEFGGIVTELGEDVVGWSPGLPVAVDPNLTCGSCRECLMGSRALCAERRLLGMDRDGGLQSFVDIPPAQAVPVPEGADPRSLGLVEPLAVAVHAVRRTGVAPGMRIGVIGGGAIGSSVVCCAQRVGADSVQVVEPDELRRRALRERGIEARADAEGLEAEWDAVIDTVGIGSTVRAAVTAVRNSATVCVVGLGHGSAMPPAQDLVRRETTLTGSFCYDRADLHEAADIVAEHGLSAIPLEVVPGLDRTPEVVEGLAAGDLGAGKTVMLARRKDNDE